MLMAPPIQILKEYFGYTSFRPYQEEIVSDVIDNRDVLAVLATGSGKSVCYQLPALLKDGVTIVVSPLIALMKDQVDALRAKGISAATINSSLSYSEQRRIQAEVLANTIKILYLSPERILQGPFLEFLKQASISLFAIDEAHCISTWGHDFRPDYRQLACLKEIFPNTPFIALTATAIHEVRDDIIKQLKLREPKVYIGSFNRENLNYVIRPKKNAYPALLEYLKRNQGKSGIIYCLSRKSTEHLAQRLQNAGFAALPYHAGLPDPIREDTQERFIFGKDPIICATIAFGMGVDKPDVRFVIHMDLPKNLEAYYQETGRAGRDGKESDCILFYGRGDKFRLLGMIDREFQANPEQLQVARRKLFDLVRYCKADECRRSMLLHYFGEDYTTVPCNACDICMHESDSPLPGESGGCPDASRIPASPRTRLGPWGSADTSVILKTITECIAQLQTPHSPSYIAKVITGSHSNRVVQNGHNLLPCYGTDKNYTRKQWTDFVRLLIEDGRLDTRYVSGAGGLRAGTIRHQDAVLPALSSEVVNPTCEEKHGERKSADIDEVIP
jgi:ATP-dependent DNA helicase RecQ